MLTVYIYPKMAHGLRGTTVGLDRKGFFKTASAELKKTLTNFLAAEKLTQINIQIADGFASPAELTAKEHALILISPYLKGSLTATAPNEIFLTENEFAGQSLERIYRLLREV